jgi:hypothetical protein
MEKPSSLSVLSIFTENDKAASRSNNLFFLILSRKSADFAARNARIADYSLFEFRKSFSSGSSEFPGRRSTFAETRVKQRKKQTCSDTANQLRVAEINKTRGHLDPRSMEK